jgi:hypothetical protein
MLDLIESIIRDMTKGGALELVFSGLLPSLSAVACYVFFGVALTSLSRATGIGKVWMAWIPFANLYLLGLLADIYTDNRLTDDADRARPFYAPSNLRRKMLGYGIGSGVSGVLATFGATLCIAGGALAFFTIIGLLAGGDLPSDPPPIVGVMMGIGALLGFVAGIFFLVFTVMFLISFCPALNRVFTALGAPVPALWVLLTIFVPVAAAIALFVFAVRRRESLAERFSAPVGETDEGGRSD